MVESSFCATFSEYNCKKVQQRKKKNGKKYLRPRVDFVADVGDPISVEIHKTEFLAAKNSLTNFLDLIILQLQLL
jgi:hypothetical protein